MIKFHVGFRLLLFNITARFIIKIKLFPCIYIYISNGYYFGILCHLGVDGAHELMLEESLFNLLNININLTTFFIF